MEHISKAIDKAIVALRMRNPGATQDEAAATVNAVLRDAFVRGEIINFHITPGVGGELDCKVQQYFNSAPSVIRVAAPTGPLGFHARGPGVESLQDAAKRRTGTVRNQRQCQGIPSDACSRTLDAVQARVNDRYAEARPYVTDAQMMHFVRDELRECVASGLIRRFGLPSVEAHGQVSAVVLVTPADPEVRIWFGEAPTFASPDAPAPECEWCKTQVGVSVRRFVHPAVRIGADTVPSQTEDVAACAECVPKMEGVSGAKCEPLGGSVPLTRVDVLGSKVAREVVQGAPLTAREVAAAESVPARSVASFTLPAGALKPGDRIEVNVTTSGNGGPHRATLTVAQPEPFTHLACGAELDGMVQHIAGCTPRQPGEDDKALRARAHACLLARPGVNSAAGLPSREYQGTVVNDGGMLREGVDYSVVGCEISWSSNTPTSPVPELGRIVNRRMWDAQTGREVTVAVREYEPPLSGERIDTSPAPVEKPAEHRQEDPPKTCEDCGCHHGDDGRSVYGRKSGGIARTLCTDCYCSAAGRAQHAEESRVATERQLAEDSARKEELRALIASAPDDWDLLPSAENEGSVIARPK